MSVRTDLAIEEKIAENGINILKENPKVKQEEIAQQIGKSLRTVKSRMIEMQEKGLIERKNGKRDGEWIINVNS